MGNEVLLNAVHLFIFFILLKIRNIRSGCYTNHHEPQCNNPPKENVAEEEDTIIAIISQANLVINVDKWVVDFGAIRHIYANISVFSSYTSATNEEKYAYLSDYKATFILKKRKSSSTNQICEDSGLKQCATCAIY